MLSWDLRFEETTALSPELSSGFGFNPPGIPADASHQETGFHSSMVKESLDSEESGSLGLVVCPRVDDINPALPILGNIPFFP